MKRLLLAALVAVAFYARPSAAQQGGGVVFVPPIIANHCVKWLTYNIIEDAGAPCGSGSGSVTSITNSDGTLTLSPNPITGAGTVALALGHANTWTGAQSITDGDLVLLGSGSGSSTLKAPATGGGTVTLPAGTGTLCFTSACAASGATFTLGSTSIALGSTATTVTGLSIAAGGSNTLAGSSVTIGAGSAITSSGAGGALGSNAFSSTAYAPLASPTFTGTVGGAGVIPLTTLATQTTNTIVGNATSGTASPTALSIGTCSTSSSALIWTTNTGFGCNTSITANAIAVGGITGLGTGIATWLATPSSANLAAALTDEVGSAGGGKAVFNFSPNFTGTSGGIESTWSDGANGTATISTPNVGIALLMGTVGTSLCLGANTVQQGCVTTTGLNSIAIGASIASTGAFTALSETGVATFSGLASDATLTDRSVCQVTATSVLAYGSGTLGICLGTSSARYKASIVPLIPGLREILALKPKSFYLDKAHGDPKKQMYGFVAEDMVKVLPKLVGLDKKGKPDTADYLGVVPVLVNAMQQEHREIVSLESENALLRAANDNDHRDIGLLKAEFRALGRARRIRQARN